MDNKTNQRVALFLPSLRGGGAERVMVTLANGLTQRGISVDLVLAKAEGPYLKEVSSAVRIVDLKASRVLFSLFGLVKYLKKEKPDVLLSTLEHANVIALWAKALAGGKTKCVIRMANTMSASARQTLRSKFIPGCLKIFSPWADAIVVVSKASAQDLIDFLKIRETKVRVIYNPVVNDELLKKANAPIDHPWLANGQPPVILGVGRLSKQKDFSTLIRAFALLRKERPARLMILGDGEERAMLQELISQLGLDADAALPGFIDNPFPYMKKASVFVLPSRWEGLPNVLIQAVALGTPAVATDSPGGSAEVLKGGERGILVPVGAVEKLSEALAKQLDGGKKGNDRAMTEFSEEVVFNQYTQLFNSI